MPKDTVDSVLKNIASLNLNNAISDSYNDVAESIRETGAPSNNILLSLILSEIRRGNEETMKLTNAINKLNDSVGSMSDKMLESIDSQTEILGSISISSGETQQKQRPKGKAGVEDWYYIGTRLSSKHHVFACLIVQIMSIVQSHLDEKNIQYPDSVDCEFNIMVLMVRVVSSARCKTPKIEYKSEIKLSSTTDQAFDTVYPAISAQDEKFATTLTESSLMKMVNPITRNVMQQAEYIRERLCLLDCILSARQIDILRSIKFPFIVDEKLNWDPSKIRVRSSHPQTQDIIGLQSRQKESYALARLHGNSIMESYDIAVSSKKP